MAASLWAWVHYLGFMGMFAILTALHLHIKSPGAAQQVKRIKVLGILLLVTLAVVLITGLAKMFDPGAGGKGAAYYAKSPLLHVKLTVFLLVFVLSFYPLFVAKCLRRQLAQAAEQSCEPAIPSIFGVVLKVQLTLMVVIPLLAALLARGYGGPSSDESAATPQTSVDTSVVE